MDGGARAESQHSRARGFARWFSWIFGIAMLAAVVIAALHFSEEREFVHMAERAEPWWMIVAIALQVGTYFAQGESWRVVTRAAGAAVPLGEMFKLSLAKLFVDQALPSGGISGTYIVARGLEQRGVARSTVMAAIVVDMVSYYGAYVVTLAAALGIMIVAGHASPVIVATAVFFLVFSVAFAVVSLALSGRTYRVPVWLQRVPVLRQVLALLATANRELARSLSLLLKSGGYQLAIVLFDAATVWVLIRALGDHASPAGVFASFMISTLIRTVGIVPGGLGIFEAASVLTLKLTGVPVGVALAATLLFRGLSFWIPMAPGLIFSRGPRRTG